MLRNFFFIKIFFQLLRAFTPQRMNYIAVFSVTQCEINTINRNVCFKFIIIRKLFYFLFTRFYREYIIAENIFSALIYRYFSIAFVCLCNNFLSFTKSHKPSVREIVLPDLDVLFASTNF